MIRILIAAALIAVGLFVYIVSTIGIFRFKYVLNRMHVAAQGDTLGALSILLGLIVLCGFSFHSLKMLLIIIFLWLASPVASHIIAKAETMTCRHLDKEYEVIEK
ncbi:MAG: monovalent cation/H(+) antiporter subunit G [Oscillospiraceae bacterium]|nr:monovalent cation/H(+) antiporter subunit G [Oscillospiraceae bacterium]